ncbi:helix-turn-helix transcriptional regulator [Desulfovibrio sp. OttesenSCG-928-G15]|nr:helix-turn-helix transcriptional regulator [Desulfovibrio sp. OttesenSCG-928-G15]
MFTSNIRALMDKKKKTVRALRDETGLSIATIQRAISGDTIHRCELGTLAKIGAALGVKTKRLYEEKSEEPRHDK